MIPNGWQIRQGRELVGMSQDDLAAAAGVELAVVIRAELADRGPQITRGDGAAIRRALERAGIEFVQGIEVRLRKAGP